MFLCIIVSYCIVLSVCLCFPGEEQERSLLMIKGLIPNVLAGQLLETFSGHMLYAASTASSFLIREGEDPSTTPALLLGNCVVKKAQKPGWSLDKALEGPDSGILTWRAPEKGTNALLRRTGKKGTP